MKLNFKKLGETGDSLIVLHGLFGSLDNWMSLAKEWSEDKIVYLVDQRNHGQSPHSNEFDYSLLAEDLKEFIAEHKIVDPILLGHSMGGKTAMEFAVNNNSLFKKLIVVDIAPVKYNVHHYDIIDALESVPVDQIKSRKEADQYLSAKIKEFGIRQFLLKNLYWKEKGQLAWRFNLEVLKENILPISEFAISKKEYNGDTLFIKGERSNYIVDDYESLIKDKFPKAKIEIILNAGHWVHAEQREAFSEIVLNFINNERI